MVVAVSVALGLPLLHVLARVIANHPRRWSRAAVAVAYVNPTELDAEPDAERAWYERLDALDAAIAASE